MKITIAIEELETATKILKKLSKKSIDYNTDFNYTIHDNSYFKTIAIFDNENVLKNKFLVEAIDIEYTGTIIKNNDYQILAKIEHLDNNHNIVNILMDDLDFFDSIGHKKIPIGWHSCISICEHCNSNRHRKYTFMVQNLITREIKQIGSSCLKEYTGIYPDCILKFLELKNIHLEDSISESFYNENTKWFYNSYDIINVLAYAYEIINKYGYEKNGGTAEKIIKELLKKDKESTVKKNSIDFTKNMIDKIVSKNHNYYIENSSFYNNYIKDVYAILLSPCCAKRHIYRLAYLPELFLKEEQKQKRIKGLTSKHIGQIGEKLKFQFKNFNLITKYTDAYDNLVNVYKIIDVDGNTYIWRTASEILIENKNFLSGTVKNHSEFNDEKQTILIRCKLLDK